MIDLALVGLLASASFVDLGTISERAILSADSSMAGNSACPPCYFHLPRHLSILQGVVHQFAGRRLAAEQHCPSMSILLADKIAAQIVIKSRRIPYEGVRWELRSGTVKDALTFRHSRSRSPDDKLLLARRQRPTELDGMAAGPLTRGGLVAEEDCLSCLIRRLRNTDNLTRRLFIADRIASI